MLLAVGNLCFICYSFGKSERTSKTDRYNGNLINLPSRPSGANILGMKV